MPLTFTEPNFVVRDISGSTLTILDIFPIGSATDQLSVYRETVIGSVAWDQVGIAGGLPSAGLLITSSSHRYAPWNTGNIYIECTNFSGNTHYFDTFTMSVIDV